jgi:hypothetical protein
MVDRRQLMHAIAVGLPAAALGGVVSQVSTAYAGSGTKAVTADPCEPPPCAPGTGRVVQWGVPTLKPVPELGLAGVTAIAAGGNYALLVRDGRVTLWGNLYLGDPAQQRLARVPVAATKDVTAVATGSYHGYALRDGVDHERPGRRMGPQQSRAARHPRRGPVRGKCYLMRLPVPGLGLILCGTPARRAASSPRAGGAMIVGVSAAVAPAIVGQETATREMAVHGLSFTCVRRHAMASVMLRAR